MLMLLLLRLHAQGLLWSLNLRLHRHYGIPDRSSAGGVTEEGRLRKWRKLLLLHRLLLMLLLLLLLLLHRMLHRLRLLRLHHRGRTFRRSQSRDVGLRLRLGVVEGDSEQRLRSLLLVRLPITSDRVGPGPVILLRPLLVDKIDKSV